MRKTFNAGVGGDNSYYWEPVSEELSWDAYSRYEVMSDDYADVEHLLAMREPVRVATSPDTYSAPKSYACERCGVLRSKRSDRTPLTPLCLDCSVVERHADPAPVETSGQRRLRLDPPPAVSKEKIQRGRTVRRMYAPRTAARKESAKRHALAMEARERMRARQLANKAVLEGRLAEHLEQATRKESEQKKRHADDAAKRSLRKRYQAEARERAAAEPPKKPRVVAFLDDEHPKKTQPRAAQPPRGRAPKLPPEEIRERSRLARLAVNLERQAEQERQFLEDIEASGASWLLDKKRA